MIKIKFSPEFIQWVALQMRANNTGLDAKSFAVEFFHRAFIGRGSEVLEAAPALLEALEALTDFTVSRYASGGESLEVVKNARAAIAQARGE